jgi:3'5'-cyclic nucleotide phosphodiesterase
VSQDEIDALRQLTVDCVLATDIFDKNLNIVRESQWQKTFVNKNELLSTQQETERKVILLEYIMQVSNVIHTMQRWTIYQKWSQRLFCELYEAYRSGQSDDNPADGWYLGELCFFDEYVLPLAKNLNVNDAFDASCHEFVSNAIENRNEWEKKGKELVIRWMALTSDSNEESIASLPI